MPFPSLVAAECAGSGPQLLSELTVETRERRETAAHCHFGDPVFSASQFRSSHADAKIVQIIERGGSRCTLENPSEIGDAHMTEACGGRNRGRFCVVSAEVGDGRRHPLEVSGLRGGKGLSRKYTGFLSEMERQQQKQRTPLLLLFRVEQIRQQPAAPGIAGTVMDVAEPGTAERGEGAQIQIWEMGQQEPFKIQIEPDPV